MISTSFVSSQLKNCFTIRVKWADLENSLNFQVKLLVPLMASFCPFISSVRTLRVEERQELHPAHDRLFFEYTSPWWGLPKFDLGKKKGKLQVAKS